MGVEYFTRTVLCAACCDEHELELGVNSNEDSEWPYVGRCPNTGRLVYSKIEAPDEEWGPDSAQETLERGPR